MTLPQCTQCGGYATQGEFLSPKGNVSLELVPLTVSFATLSEVWKKTRGVELSHAEIERIVLHRGQQFLALQQEAYEQELEPSLEEAPKLLYISCDGTFCHAAEPGHRKVEGRLGMVFTDTRAEVSSGRFERWQKPSDSSDACIPEWPRRSYPTAAINSGSNWEIPSGIWTPTARGSSTMPRPNRRAILSVPPSSNQLSTTCWPIG